MEKYIAIITSKWHLFGLESYLLEKKIGSNTEINVIIQYHNASSSYRICDEDFIFLSSFNLKKWYIKNTNELYSIIESIELGREDVFFITVKEIPTKAFLKLLKGTNVKKIKSIIIDEGIGTYSKKKFWKMCLDRELNKEVTKLGSIINRCKDFVNNVINLLVKKEVRYLYKVKDEKLQLNEKICKSYKVYFNLRKEKLKEKYYFNEMPILLITNCLNNIIDNIDEEISEYKRILNIVKSKFPNQKIYIKPHPNELQKFKKLQSVLEVEILEKNICLEDILNSNKISFVLGFSSTGLLTSSQIFNIKTLCLNSHLDINKLSDFGKISINNFNKITTDLPIEKL